MTDIVIGGPDGYSPRAGVQGGTLIIRAYAVYTPTLHGQFHIEGSLSPRIPRPQPLTPIAGWFGFQGALAAAVDVPAAAFADFSHFPYGGTDPAMAYIGVTSGALTSAAAGSYARQYAAFTGPQDYPVSTGGYAWKRAAYAAVGFKFAGMQANKDQILDAIQYEALPLPAAGPTPYSTARSLQVVVRPTRLNYATNPNMESGITGYTAVASGTPTADTSFFWRGTQSMKVTVPSTATQDSGASLTIDGLIPGTVYTLSARVAVAVGCGDVVPFTGAGAASRTPVSYRQAVEDPDNARWRAVWITFTAEQSSVSVGLTVPVATLTGSDSIFWVDGVLVEEGTAPGQYFDGSMGTDYLWETGGSANLARSYYYEDRVERSYLIRTLLAENTPLGITYADPQYGVLPTQ